MLPRFGFQFQMPSDFEQLRYFGRGPTESYSDKHHASRIGLYSCNATDHFEHYIKPQENMAHIQTKWLTLTKETGLGLCVSATEQQGAISFNCSHYTPIQLTQTAHDYELQALSEVVVNVDLCQSGIGSNSCGPSLAEKYCPNEK